MSEYDELQKQWDEMFVPSILRDIGFRSHEIKIIRGILEKENINLVSLLRQAIRKWAGEEMEITIDSFNIEREEP